MTDQQDLNRRFENSKSHMIMCSDTNTEPTDKEVWEFMKTLAKKNQEEALMDDMEGFVIAYQKRIKLIDEQLEAIHVNEQAEMNKAVNRYEQGMGVD